MDSHESLSKVQSVEMIFDVHPVESSIEQPMDQWSSLEIIIPEENKKKILYKQGLYDIGSGEICAKHLYVSDSSIFRHPYFNYPAIRDPGIEEALLQPEKPIIYDNDGQDLYLAVCKEMNMCPVRSFWRGLKDTVIDLRYYCVNPYGVRAMAAALRYNPTVLSFILIDNFLNNDACFHLADMLLTNTTLTELDLQGCRIGASGAQRLFHCLPQNRTLVSLNLSANQIGDAGMVYLADSIFYGLEVKQINLSNNNISGKGVNLLTVAFETHNRFTHINLAWNNLHTPGTYAFLNKLAESQNLRVLNLAWNALSGPRMGIALKNITTSPFLRKLILNNNQLEGEAIRTIITSLNKAKKMVVLNLAGNPLSSDDAFAVLTRLKSVAVKVTKVYMSNVFVTKEFVTLLEHIKQMKSKKNLIVTYGGVIDTFSAQGPDIKMLLLNRIEFITQKSKRHKIDFALIALQLQKNNVRIMNIKEFATYVRDAGAALDDDLIEELVSAFPGPRSAKFKLIDINLLVEHCKRKWPDKKLPVTPPPEPEPDPELLPPPPPPPPPKGKKGKK